MTIGAPVITSTTLVMHWLALQERFVKPVHRSTIAQVLADSSACRDAMAAGSVASCDGAHLTGLSVGTPRPPNLRAEGSNPPLRRGAL